jgi:hypothetical protein
VQATFSIGALADSRFSGVVVEEHEGTTPF